MKAKTAWIPRKKYFQMVAAGLITPKKKSARRKCRKARRTKRVKTRRTSKVTKAKEFKLKGVPKIRTFTIYVKGEEKETVTGKSQRAAEIAAQKKYHTKNILIGESYENK